ncbi:hypothetical protein GCM10011609_33580 [Lentzea pudingi]|uniref:MarR family transcriptional regulator n=2 Tax=Lentzea pudingi TaxID=1789439 RepID=A0ABQ2I068_9PSEU|nr:hypothetical protein GCM10011609_33580 [Lentzea pudingi]
MTDAEIVRELVRLHPRATHQTVNQICRQLAVEGLIARDGADRPILNRLRDGIQQVPREPVPVPATSPKAWPWEGAVQEAVVGWLEARGAAIRSQVDTAARQRGTDVVAFWQGSVLHIEVKGWPSAEYADPKRAHETKPTRPSLQASHWFAGALSSALRLREAHADDRVVMAFPNKQRYRNLHAERHGVLHQVRIEVWYIDESGQMECDGA